MKRINYSVPLLIVFVVFVTVLIYTSVQTESFTFPSDQVYPANNNWWGYRDPVSTKLTLEYEESQPYELIKGTAKCPEPILRAKSVDTAYVEPAPSPNPVYYPPVAKPPQSAQANSPYANWASSLGA